jgi:hypothetical protein
MHEFVRLLAILPFGEHLVAVIQKPDALCSLNVPTLQKQRRHPPARFRQGLIMARLDKKREEMAQKLARFAAALLRLTQLWPHQWAAKITHSSQGCYFEAIRGPRDVSSLVPASDEMDVHKSFAAWNSDGLGR